MTKANLILILAVFCGAVFGNDAASLDGMVSQDGIRPSVSIGPSEELQRTLRLTEGQVERLRTIHFSLEDAIFPLFRKYIDKIWESGRESRKDQPNEATLLTIVNEIARIDEQARNVATKYRNMSRAVLNQDQIEVLKRLETVLASMSDARAAADFNLIEARADDADGLGVLGMVSEDGVRPSVSIGPSEELQRTLRLTEAQVERLRTIHFSFEDAIFPLFRKYIDKIWESGRESRKDQPNEATLLTIVKDIARMDEHARHVATMYRNMSRAVLSQNQIEVLKRLETVLASMSQAQAAADFNLIEARADDDDGFGVLGLGKVKASSAFPVPFVGLLDSRD